MGRAIYYWRNNVLDRYVCNVRDCWAHDGSYSVDLSGKKTDLCFQRRKSEVKTKAFLDTTRLPSRLRELIDIKTKTLNRLQEHGVTLGSQQVFSFDLLYGYENQKSGPALFKSVRAWQKLMKCFGVEVLFKRITNVLRPDVGSLPFPPHSQTIYNIDQVYQKLSQAANINLRPLLRMPRVSRQSGTRRRRSRYR